MYYHSAMEKEGKIMKKILSFALALCLLLSTCITAFAQETVSSDDVKKQITSTVSYLTKETAEYTVDDAVNLYYLVNSEVEIKNTDSFLTSVKENLKANDGKIISSYGESITTYAAVIQILFTLGENPTSFEGYDITKAFSAMDPAVKQDNPYFYNIIIPASFFAEDESFGKKACDSFVANYYTAGKGVDYYGFSCDNTCYLVSALSNYYEDYKTVIDDCLAVLESHKTDGGYFYNSEYGTTPNGNSTALALMAYSACYINCPDGEISKEKCDSIYKDLLTFKGEEDGTFTYMNDGDNPYATWDALRGAELYYSVLYLDEMMNAVDDVTEKVETAEPVEKEEAPSETTEKPEKETTAKAVITEKKSPATGAETSGIALTSALFVSLGAVALLRKRVK